MQVRMQEHKLANQTSVQNMKTAKEEIKLQEFTQI